MDATTHKRIVELYKSIIPLEVGMAEEYNIGEGEQSISLFVDRNANGYSLIAAKALSADVNDKPVVINDSIHPNAFDSAIWGVAVFNTLYGEYNE